MSEDVKPPDDVPSTEAAPPPPSESESAALSAAEPVADVVPEPLVRDEQPAEAHEAKVEAAAVPEPLLRGDDLDMDDEEEVAEPAEPEPVAAVVEEPPPAEENKKHWYVVKVQSGREDTIKEAIERRARKEAVEEYFGQIVIPVEKYQEIKTDKNGKRVTRTKERKLYPGYLMVEVEYNDRILYLFRETSGVGDFVGAHPGDLTRAPTALGPREVERMIGKGGKPGEKEEPVSPKPKWLQEGDRVRVADGTFNGMDGVVKKIKEVESKVEVEVSIFGRPVPVELEYYQVEQL